MTARLVIEYGVTADMADGQPLPPYIDNGTVWHVVCRLPGNCTRWRRTRLSDQTDMAAAGSRRNR
jgi:hypothetical protein